MSRDELFELVSDFRKTLGELKRMGCDLASSEPCAPVTESAPALAVAPVSAQAPAAADETPSADETPIVSGHRLPLIREEIGDCQRCTLRASRTNIVFGLGSQTAALMFIGHVPGADDDLRGEPFVGKAGQLLDKMIVAMGWQREEVYVSTVLKCRPPNLVEPTRDQIDACEGFLAQQIEAVGPSVIVTLGKAAAQSLLGSGEREGGIRGTWQQYAGIPVMPTYHPEHLLLEPTKKREAWADLQEVMQRLKTLGVGPS